MPTTSELIAHGRSVEEIREFIGADALIYQDVDAMKRVVGGAEPAARRLRGLLLRRPLRHRRRQRRRLRALEAQRRAAVEEEDGDDRAALALQGSAKGMSDRRSCRASTCRPALRLDTLAVREGLPPSPVGRELRGAVPHQPLRAARCRDRGAPLRQRGRGLHLQPLLQPDGDDHRAAPGGAGRHRGGASAPPAAWRAILLLIMGLLKARRPRGLLAVGVRLDDQAVRRSSPSSASRPPSSRRPTSTHGAPRCGRTRSCCSPRRRPIR